MGEFVFNSIVIIALLSLKYYCIYRIVKAIARNEADRAKRDIIRMMKNSDSYSEPWKPTGNIRNDIRSRMSANFKNYRASQPPSIKSIPIK